MIHFSLPEADEETFEQVVDQLQGISLRLYELLPDPALSPQERLERLARICPASTLVSAHHRTARSKLNELRIRLAELVPTKDLSDREKIEFLVDLVHEMVPETEMKFFKKLELLGDSRPADNGR